MSKKEAKTHTKTEFEAKVAEKISLTKSDSKKVVDAFLETVTEVLAAG
ncbi:HU family DNA-binding protein, partial [Fangia hongkongensis]